MSNRRQMIEELLNDLSSIEKMSTFPITGQEQQLFTWIGRVSASLEAAGMTEELDIWRVAIQDGIPFSYTDRSTLNIQIGTLRPILTGILAKLEQTGLSGTLFPMELVIGTRPYIEKIAEQANGCYQRGWYDACAVMLRRLIETMIIECFEQHNLAAKIKDEAGDYFYLRDLISAFKRETAWHMPRGMDKYLDALKAIGDASAHNRYYTAARNDIEKVADPIRFTIQPLVYIAKF
jgi:hypothetical protein